MTFSFPSVCTNYFSMCYSLVLDGQYLLYVWFRESSKVMWNVDNSLNPETKIAASDHLASQMDHPPPTFGSSSNLEALALQASESDVRLFSVGIFGSFTLPRLYSCYSSHIHEKDRHHVLFSLEITF